MTDENPLFAMLLGQSQFLGPGAELENTLEPTTEQFALKPGDKCLAATANTMLEEDFTVLEIVDHTSPIYTEMFPDGMQVRWQLNSHVLGNWFSVDYPEGDVGWFSRVKLIQITEEEYAEATTWRTNGFPPHPPQWIQDRFTVYTDVMSSQEPASIPILVTCLECSGRAVDLKIIGKKTLDARAGQITRNGQTVYVPLNNPTESLDWNVRLECSDCGAYADLDLDEWELGG